MRFEIFFPDDEFPTELLIPDFSVSETPVPYAVAAPVGEIVIDRFTGIVNGQTEFTLLSLPRQPDEVRLTINHAIYGPPSFTVVGTLLTWASEFSILSSDIIEATYPI